MSGTVVVLRPEPGSAATVTAARAQGIEAVASPLFEIRPVAWLSPDPSQFDAIVAGSANAFRGGGHGLTALTGLPVLAVGESTATAARAAGFTVEATGHGGLQATLDTVNGPTRLLRLAGEARVELSPPAGVTIEERVVYRAEPLALSGAAAAALMRGAIALVHSGEAARRFAEECTRLGLARTSISAAALAPRIADALGTGWHRVTVARAVTDGALLALAKDMCH